MPNQGGKRGKLSLANVAHSSYVNHVAVLKGRANNTSIVGYISLKASQFTKKSPACGDKLQQPFH